MTQIFCRRLNLGRGIVRLRVGLPYDRLRFSPRFFDLFSSFIFNLLSGLNFINKIIKSFCFSVGVKHIYFLYFYLNLLSGLNLFILYFYINLLSGLNLIIFLYLYKSTVGVKNLQFLYYNENFLSGFNKYYFYFHKIIF